jgi:hypothetical protein
LQGGAYVGHFQHLDPLLDERQIIFRRTLSESFLHEMQVEFPTVFAEPWHTAEGRPIEHSIVLKDVEIPPRKLYLLREAELAELKKQMKLFLESGFIVPLSSPYGAPNLFTAKNYGGRDSPLQISTAPNR